VLAQAEADSAAFCSIRECTFSVAETELAWVVRADGSGQDVSGQPLHAYCGKQFFVYGRSLQLLVHFRECPAKSPTDGPTHEETSIIEDARLRASVFCSVSAEGCDFSSEHVAGGWAVRAEPSIRSDGGALQWDICGAMYYVYDQGGQFLASVSEC